jgi:hypothetical protein
MPRYFVLRLLIVCLLSPLAVETATAKPAVAAACPFKDKEQVVVAGIARSIMSGAEEPNESINTYFYLETSGPPCGSQRISVFATGIIPCIEGDRATVRGIYYAPDPIFNQPMIDLATVTCSR